MERPQLPLHPHRFLLAEAAEERTRAEGQSDGVRPGDRSRVTEGDRRRPQLEEDEDVLGDPGGDGAGLRAADNVSKVISDIIDGDDSDPLACLRSC